ncbi:MAG TPA: helix-turn-helix transcriptional regulator [Devosiaceae bacterium]|jgi:DNA-binding NarL/FixJ family response regulator|nr:helix-turn-helix transcriptional regulator [Devosiaceae bacterium]
MEQLPVQMTAARRPPSAVQVPPPAVEDPPGRRRRRPVRERERLIYILDPDTETCAALAAALRSEALQDRPLVEAAVAAMKAGATDVLIKPLDPERLVLLVRDALRQPGLHPPERPSGPGARIELTRREREVLQLIARGHSNREAGEHLGISQRTIEVHRARVMEKFGARNAADLMRIVLTR